MTTSVLSSLKVIARPKIEPKPPVLGKRLKLIEKLEQQKEMAVCMIENRRFEAFRDKKVKNPETGEVTVQRRPTTVRPWYYDSDDHYYLEVKVNNKPIELQKGKPSIDIGDKAKLPEVIDTIIKATESGELDEFLLKPAVPKKAKQ
ncbi:hypothetical protein DRW07_15425 [Alteromonas sediminis]|jgi:hypothetical protein|uniref:Uncharacterized protein n=1 Tax=Alteromonas sediminis TaxID=2259342 RepID=A0A3N5Y9I4_9ALTE|nr:DUF6641 family protein [Alteromonas sediminis]RPJ65295.1 hypothetical protein DRW07_15425 [Alteromonas sediminis]|tara:strand:- start:143 stop:580 length:438 start_codon:yes stop_codon:yes gene_type:complete